MPKTPQTPPPFPSRNKWWGNVATDLDDKAHDGAPDPQGHPLTRRGHIGSSSPAKALKPLWPLPPLSQPQPPTLTPTPTGPCRAHPRSDGAGQLLIACPFSKREQARGQRDLPLSEGPWLRHSIPPPLHYQLPTTPTTQYTRQPPLILVPQGWRAAVCYAIPHIMYNVYSVPLQSPSMEFQCVFPCFL